MNALDLFGTDEPPAERRALCAGRLSAILEEGNLRDVCFDGVQVIRSINYLARDTSWGTYRPEITDVRISESGSAFDVSYDGLCAGPEGRFSYRMTLRGEASGKLVLKAEGTALTDFPTNRTGFTVLHPADAAGGRLTVRHSDGRIAETAFPIAISPDQPAIDIAALTHEPAPGLICTVEMEGDAFEMEDQRNWADASFKTYVRPLAKPRPYVIRKGETDRQGIAVTIQAGASGPRAKTASGATLSLGEVSGRMPAMALFLDPDDLPEASAHAASLGPVQDIIVRFDEARGHDAATLSQAAAFAASIGARLAVEAIFNALDPDAEAKCIASALRASAIDPSAVLISPRREFKTRSSNALPPGEAAIGDLADALRAQGVRAAIGLGTPSFFTEFNRNPPAGEAAFVFFSVTSVVHAADDVSVMETVRTYPSLIASARGLCPGKAIWLGPCTIAMRHNPYGAEVAANPKRSRVPSAGEDPRHGALFGAAFVAGVAAAAADVDRLIVASPTGRFGLIDATGHPRPMQAVHAELGAAAGAERYAVSVDHPDIAAIAFRSGQSTRVMVANLSAEDVQLAIPGNWDGMLLIGQAAPNPQPVAGQVTLGGYRTMVLQGG